MAISNTILDKKLLWASRWQNQQTECAPCNDRSAWASAQSDQSLRCLPNRKLKTQGVFMQTAKTLIRLGGCPGWSESSLDAVILLVLSCRGSYVVVGLSNIYGSLHDKTNKMTFAPSEDLDQPGHPWVWSASLLSAWKNLCYPLKAQQRLRSDWADAPADLSLLWVHRSFSWFCLAQALIASELISITSINVIMGEYQKPINQYVCQNMGIYTRLYEASASKLSHLRLCCSQQ